MPDETQDGSQNNATGVDVRPGNRSNGAPQKAKGPDPAISARNALLDDIDARIAAQRAQETRDVIAGGDDEARAFLARAARERGESLDDLGRGAAESEGTDEVTDDQGVTDDTSAADDVATRSAEQATAVDAAGNDPLAEFVVVRGGKPMFKTKVDGKEQLVPLETARAQLQKHLAADLRLQDIAKQRRELEARARNLQSAEAALRVRTSQPSAQPAAVDDQALEAESLDLVKSLVDEPLPVAAKKLATVLAKTRQAQAPQVDISAVAQQAAGMAVQTVVAHDHQKALTAGLKAFNEKYGDIASDPDLYAMADRRTDAIAEEHRDWTPTQVMLEAGRQTQEWLAKRAGLPVGTPTVTNGRQQRKDGLRPMPTARTARAATTQQAEPEQSPQSALQEIRKARGQFV